MESISLWHCSGVMRAQVALIVAFSSSALFGLAYRIFLFTIPHRFSMGLRSGEFAGQLREGIPWYPWLLFFDLVLLVKLVIFFFLLIIFVLSPCLDWTSYVPVEPCPVLSLCCYRVPVLTCSCYWFTLPGTWPASESEVNKYLSSALWCLPWPFPSAWPCFFFCCYSAS